jgi:hypothetical protein
MMATRAELVEPFEGLPSPHTRVIFSKLFLSNFQNRKTFLFSFLRLHEIAYPPLSKKTTMSARESAVDDASVLMCIVHCTSGASNLAEDEPDELGVTAELESRSS